MCNIKTATYIKDYKILFEFINEKKREIDFKPFLEMKRKYKLYRTYLDKTNFQKFKIDQHGIYWDNDMDFSSGSLYSSDWSLVGVLKHELSILRYFAEKIAITGIHPRYVYIVLAGTGDVLKKKDNFITADYDMEKALEYAEKLAEKYSCKRIRKGKFSTTKRKNEISVWQRKKTAIKLKSLESFCIVVYQLKTY